MSDIGPGDVVVVVNSSRSPRTTYHNPPPPRGSRQLVVACVRADGLVIAGFPNVSRGGFVVRPDGSQYPFGNGEEMGWHVSRFRKADRGDLGELLNVLEVHPRESVDA